MHAILEHNSFSVYIRMLLLRKIYVINQFLLLGMFTLPFNMVANTPIECTLDRNHPNFSASVLNSRAVVSCLHVAMFTCEQITLMKSSVAYIILSYYISILLLLLYYTTILLYTTSSNYVAQ